MAKIQFYAQKIDGESMKLEDRPAFEDFQKTAQPGRWRLDAIRDRKPMSQKQRGNMFGNIIAKIKQEANEVRQEGVDSLLVYLIDPNIPKGQAVTDDFIKELCYMIAPTYGENGRKKTMRSMNTAEAAHFTERIRNIFANYVEIPEPRKDWRDNETT